MESAALVNVPPLQERSNASFVMAPATSAPEDQPLAAVRIISPCYFQTLRTPLLMGRFFDRRDVDQGRRVAIVTREFADKFFTDKDPLGKLVATYLSSGEYMEIVGVVGDVKAGAIAGRLAPAIYHPHKQAIRRQMSFLIRTSSDPGRIVQAVRGQILALDPDQPVSSVEALSQVVDKRLGSNRLTMHLMGAFAALALFLAVLGIYGVISYAVSTRTREIGIRMALGAQRRHAFGSVISQALKLAAIGAALGLTASAAVTRWLGSLLFGVTALDGYSYAAMTIVLIMMSLLASALPARRATRVDPVVAQRE